MPTFTVQAFCIIPLSATTTRFSMKHAAHNKWPVKIVITKTNQHLVTRFRYNNESPVFSTTFSAAGIRSHHPQPLGEQVVILLPEHLYPHPAHIVRVLVIFDRSNLRLRYRYGDVLNR